MEGDHSMTDVNSQLKRKLRAILDSLNDNVCLLDENGEIEEVNTSWLKYAGENDAILDKIGPGNNYLEICEQAEGDREEGQTALKFSSGIREVISGEKDYYELEHPCHSPEEEQWFIGKVTPYIESNGSKRKVVVAHQDITEKKLAERERTITHNFLNNSIDQITYQDTDMNIIWVNRAVEKFLNKTRENITGKKCYEAGCGILGSCGNCAVEEAMRTGYTITRERHDVHGRHFSVIGSPVKDDNGNVEGIVKTNIDITEQKQLENELYVKDQAMASAINAIALADSEGKLYYVNHSFLYLLGYDYENEVLGMSLQSFMTDENKLADMFDTIFYQKIWNDTVQVKRKDGYFIEANFSSSIIHGEETSHITIVASFIDVTGRKETERSLIRFRNALDSSADSIFIVDYPSYNFIDVNKTACVELGYSQKELLQLTPFDIISGMSKKTLKSKFQKALQCDWSETSNYVGVDRECVETFETEYRRKNKTLFPVEISIRFSDLPGEQWFILSARNITERKKADEKMQFLSYNDTLTGLYNRTFLEQSMQKYDVKKYLPISIIMADINGLKLINDTYGHQTGDELLVNAGKILRETCRGEDIIARWGGDEFVIFLPRTDEKVACKIVKRIKENSMNYQVKSVPLQISMGVATKEKVDELLEDIFKLAEDRMYQNKLADRNGTRSDIISALTGTLKEISDETEEHAHRMTKLGFEFGEALGLRQEDLDKLSILATIHDIGKVVIPEKILKKPGNLNEEEWEKIKEHPEIGQRIARNSERLISVAEEILSHHERWDGTGYPYGLKGRDIPMLSRVLAILDAYDVMTHDRSYKESMSKEKALQELKKCAGTQFDPELVDVFLDVMDS